MAGALIVQPGNHLYDHSYVTSVLRQHKGRLAGCLLADPTPGGGGVAALEQLVQQERYVAVRFNPYLWSEGEKMSNEVCGCTRACSPGLGTPASPGSVMLLLGCCCQCCVLAMAHMPGPSPDLASHWEQAQVQAQAQEAQAGAVADSACSRAPPVQVGRAMYRRAGELGAPVGHMPFKGLLNHIEDIQQLCQEYPGTRAIIDHCGFCKCDDLQSAEWRALLGLARFPQVAVPGTRAACAACCACTL